MKKFSLKTKLITGVLSCALVSTLVPMNTFAQTPYENNTDCKCEKPVDKEQLQKINSNFGTPITIAETDNNLDIGLEIAKSDLEEKSIITENGTIKNYYKSASDAGVREEAFNRFESVINELNKSIEKGEISFGSNLLDININRSKISNIISQSEVQSAAIPRATYRITHDQAVKAQKLLWAGAGVAALASELGLPMLVAGALSALAAAGGLCDWNDRGFLLIHLGGTMATCVPL
ncbi:hypothetical protein [Bacillus sp. JJ864]|uniref:hypothetical protein n=1 Tax=Bacillus sp. JJ864 TaxID=3122975 RepID=UPI003F689C1E